jgi:Mrp family chromosome partitioning ATPase
MLGIEGKRMGGSETGLIPLPVMGMGVVSVGLLLEDPDEALVWRGPLKATLLKQLIEETDWGTLDYLVVDCPPGTGDEPLSVLQCLGGADATVLVTTPQELAAADVRKSIAFCGPLESGPLFLVENLSGFVCPHCGERVNLFGSGAGAKIADRYGIPLLAQIPYDPSLIAGGDQGRPPAAFLPDSPVAETFRELAAEIRTRTEGTSEGA